MTMTLLDRIFRLTIVSLLILGIMTSLLTEAMAQDAKPAPAAAEEKPTADFTVSALSAYIWRGQQQTRDSLVLQPSMTVGYKGFSANLWGNLDTNPYSPTDA
ncbi:MAG: hypothetical protein MUE57_05970 [Syntrophales bacterium]|nr:hypothetical protein [Syntrophales bacterium]